MSDLLPRDPGAPDPLWHRMLAPLRSEEAMFKLLLGVIAFAVVATAIKLVVS